jgi:hypothetical protein
MIIFHRWLDPRIEGPLPPEDNPYVPIEFINELWVADVYVYFLKQINVLTIFKKILVWYNVQQDCAFSYIHLVYMEMKFCRFKRLILYSDATWDSRTSPWTTRSASTRLGAMPMITLRYSSVLPFCLMMILWEMQFFITTLSRNMWNQKILFSFSNL